MTAKTMAPAAALRALLLVSTAGQQAAASLLYAASYSGTVTTLNMTACAGEVGSNGTKAVPVLQTVSTTDGCKDSPSWLTLDHADALLYCIDEGLNTYPDGSLSSYRTNDDGSLSQLGKVKTVVGPVSGVFYGKDGHGLAMAHYSGSALTAWDVSDPASITSVQQEIFKLDGPGADPDRQEAPHPHEAVMDPTGSFLLVPDLGADLVRLFVPDDDSLKLNAIDPLKIAAGSGPRHVAFAVSGEKTFMYLATELGNTVIGYEVTYPDGSIKFDELFTIGAHGDGEQSPEGSSASEVVVSPDGKNLILSSRDENNLQIPNFHPDNSTSITSDPLINFAIDPETGHLDKVQEVPCGGRGPRQFSVNKDGTLVAVGLQSDGRVVLIARDLDTGKLGDFVAYADVEGEVTAVIFDE